MIKRLHLRAVVTVFALYICTTVSAQQVAAPASSLPRPKLVVGLVIDQMRWDYLYRYWDKYSAGGFKRLMAQGYSCDNTHIPYVPTYTAPGHTCIYTGSVPSLHGIIGNDWYDRYTQTRLYCTADATTHLLGVDSPIAGHSPRRMLTTTITDELRLSNQFHSRVVGIALKDRSAIYPAGHSADWAFWFDKGTGRWVSSDYYHPSLPSWVTSFNGEKLPARYLAQGWDSTYLRQSTYTESTDDDEPYEGTFDDEDKAVFPHHISGIKKDIYEVLAHTPYGNTLTLEFAKAAILGEKLGKGGYTDFLTISCSSTDYIGHMYGPNAVEQEDDFIRLDRDIANFLTYLDTQYGNGNYLLFLSADHGAAHADGFNKQHAIHSGVLSNDSIKSYCRQIAKQKFGKEKVIDKYMNFQLYFNRDSMAAWGLSDRDLKTELANGLMRLSGIAKTIDLSQVATAALPTAYRELLVNGYNQRRSGDMQLIYDPAYLEGYTQGTTHGTVYAYDTHIPLIWYGWHIRAGHDATPTYMTDIAATLATLLHIQEPSGCIGKPIEGVCK
jgi:predicted AlkP superfamily pyrophosphatase or phosphodiesterase